MVSLLITPYRIGGIINRDTFFFVLAVSKCYIFLWLCRMQRTLSQFFKVNVSNFDTQSTLSEKKSPHERFYNVSIKGHT